MEREWKTDLTLHALGYLFGLASYLIRGSINVIARIRRVLNINGAKDLEPLTVQLDARWGEGTSICEN